MMKQLRKEWEKQSVRNKEPIPFEIIERAVAGEPEAIDAVLRHYTGHINTWLPIRNLSTTVSKTV